MLYSLVADTIVTIALHITMILYLILFIMGIERYMNNSHFSHLHVHSSRGSLLDGCILIDEYAKYAKELGYTGAGLSDHSSIDGVLQFQTACEKNDITPVIGCLPAGSLIVTITGTKPVEEIEIGDLVLTHKGRFKKVTQTMSRVYSGTFYEIELAGYNRKGLVLTEEHPILIRNTKGELQWLKPAEISFGYRTKEKGKFNWNSWVCFPKLAYNDQLSVDIIDYLPDNFSSINGKIVKYPITKYDRFIEWDFPSILDIDENLSYFLGLYVADGPTYLVGGVSKQTTLSFGIHKTPLANWALSYLNQLGVRPREYIRHNKSIHEIVISYRPMGQWLALYCGTGAINKQMPPDIFQCSYRIRDKFIEGLIACDGKDPNNPTNRSSEATLKVASKNLSWQFRTLLMSKGHWTTVSTVLQDDKIAYSVPYSPYRAYSRSIDDTNFTYCPIRNISSFYDTKQVYNFEVEEDHSYVSNFVLHNCEWYVVPDPLVHNKDEKRRHCLTWVQNSTGWTNVLKLLTKANLQGFYRKPRVSYQDLLDHHEGLIFGTACLDTFLWDKEGVEFLENLLDLTDDVWIECMPHLSKEQKQTNKLLMGIQKKYGLRSVATNDNHWLYKDDDVTQQILLAIQTRKTWDDPNRWSFGKEYKLHLKTADEMITEFEKQGILPRELIIRSMRNTMKIVDQCADFRIEKQEVSLPCVPGLENVNEEEYLEQLVLKGYYEKIGEFLTPEYEARIDEELLIIKKFGRT
jgi:DNA polymerase III subunit alpha